MNVVFMLTTQELYNFYVTLNICNKTLKLHGKQVKLQAQKFSDYAYFSQKRTKLNAYRKQEKDCKTFFVLEIF